MRHNRRSADTLQSIDAVELLLDQLPSGWNPPVIDVFDALMRRDRGDGGYVLHKSYEQT